jgi:ATP-dependent DNA helicase RecG
MRQCCPEVAIGVVHGQTPVDERQRTVRRFADGELQALLATTVVEVGVDVPEATVLIIESAESFGLAQLHQLRGRIGRGAAPGWCVALHGELGEEARRRLDVLARTADGFEIAEQDLLIRGPGELLGRRQAGLPPFRVADLRTDAALLELARHDALELARGAAPAALVELAGRLDRRRDAGARLSRA